MLTHYSVDQAGSNYEKKRRKSCWTVPLNKIQKSHMTPRSMILREIDSAQYHTLGRLILRNMILRGDSEKFKCINKNSPKVKIV